MPRSVGECEDGGMVRNVGDEKTMRKDGEQASQTRVRQNSASEFSLLSWRAWGNEFVPYVAVAEWLLSPKEY